MAGREKSYSNMIEIIDQTRVFLPPKTEDSRPSALPLTFMDIPWLLLYPMQRVYFYDFPHSTLHFTNSAIPLLKRSLSAALGRFYPLAGSLASPPPPGKPHILLSHSDGIIFTTAISTADYTELISDKPQYVGLLHSLATLFPDSGLCIGARHLHVAADGTANNHFLKTWASMCMAELEGQPARIEKSLPVHDRNVVKDPNGIEPVLLKDWFSILEDNSSPSPSPNPGPSPNMDKAIATFTLSRDQISRLKSWVLTKLSPATSESELELLHLSTFSVACAYTWVCLIKSKEIERCDPSSDRDFGNIIYRFGFVADCRNRLEYPIPMTYFGNCLDLLPITLERVVLVGTHGVASAAGAIGAKVKELGREGGVLKEAKRSISMFKNAGDFVSVAGSPRQRTYETNFGWGRPRKVLLVHIDASECFSLLDSPDEEGCVEIGLALRKESMDTFSTLFQQGLNSF
ncbi:hypothetical protein CRG98_044554 [Punica granatum]|uniref:Coumaroyl-CoA:anthocyanidin 3-O-glucoside-6''-O-coumaroyltransferase 1-like n=1 Tax=Punica granatum TaxID=22663 RepID=A0A2I0HTK1_PUNGR|nr:hypothetical protein CRG98_044554 [Punica granatum]